MDEARKNELLKAKLEENVSQANNRVSELGTELEKAKIEFIWTKRGFEDYCCERAHCIMDEHHWKLYNERNYYTVKAENKMRDAKTSIENAKTRLYQAQKELQDFLDITNS